jgi:hypothetical protein
MQTKYDKFEQLTFDAQLAVAVFGNLETSDFELIALKPGPANEPVNLRERGMVFIAVMGIVNCVPQTALAVPVDAATTKTLSDAFVKHIEIVAAQELETAFLTRLYDLEDRRAN